MCGGKKLTRRRPPAKLAPVMPLAFPLAIALAFPLAIALVIALVIKRRRVRGPALGFSRWIGEQGWRRRRAWLGDLAAALAVFAGVAGVAAEPARADTLLTLASHTDGFQLQGARQSPKDSQSKVWIAGDKLRYDEGSASEIFRFDRGKLYIVDHAAKTYSEIALPIDLHKLVPRGNEQLVDQLVQMKKVEITVHPTPETRKVRDWNASKLDVELRGKEGMTVATAVWLSAEIPEYRVYNKMQASREVLQGNVDWARRLEALAGFPVLQEIVVRMMGTQFKSREELVSLRSQEAPPGTYEVPGGYAAKPYDLTSGVEP